MNFRYTGIRVRDLDRSLDFYTKVMQMKVAHKGEMAHGGRYVHLESPDSKQRLELNWYPKGSRFYTEYKNGDELDHLAFLCHDVERVYDNLLSNGCTTAIKPFIEHGFLLAFVYDPDGICIELAPCPEPTDLKFIYTGIRVSDLETSIDFFTKLLGMKVGVKQRMSHGGEIVDLKSPKLDQVLELNWYPKDNKFYTEYRNGDELDHLGFKSVGVDKEFERLVKGGCERLVEPFTESNLPDDISGDAYVKGPDEIWIELFGKR
jgi:lactoylglutathione lyase